MDLPSQFSPRPSASLVESDAVTIARSGYAYSYTADMGQLVTSRLTAVLKSLERMKPQVLTPIPSNTKSLAPSPLLQSSSFVNLAESRRDVSQASSALLKSQRVESYIHSIQDAFNIDSDGSNSTAVPLFPFKEESSSWLKSVARFIKPEGELRDQNSLLEIMSMPYIDVSTRRGRPALLRRTTSYATIPLVEATLSQPDATCEPTPVAGQTNKYASRNAVFTTSTTYPYNIRSLNDLACLMFGIQQGTVGASMLKFIEEKMHPQVVGALSANTDIPLSGSLVDIVKDNVHSIATFWVEKSGNFFIWIVEEIDMKIVECPIEGPLPSPVESITVQDLGTDLLEYEQSKLHHATVKVSGRNAPVLWSHNNDNTLKLRFPRVIGTALVLDSNHRILAYNYSSLFYMLGINPASLAGLAVDAIIPRFKSYMEAIDRLIQLKLTPGIVVPEHMFRQVACKDSKEYFEDYPHSGVSAITAKGKELFVDIELRIVSPHIHVLWITFNRPALGVDAGCIVPSQLDLLRVNSTQSLDSTSSSPTTPRVRAGSISNIPLPVSPSPFSPPSTPSESNKNIKVGARRRELKMDDFTIVRSLGEGAYGKVCMAAPKDDPSNVIIIKSIFKDRILVDTWTRDRSLGTIPNEIKILNQLRENPHPNITYLIDFFEDTKHYNIETALHGNPALDLFDYIENEQDLPIEQCRSIFTMVVSAVAYLHSLGIVHRDIKDENIIVDEAGQCQLIDFGSAAYTRKGPFDVFVGTVDYAAPEVLEGNPFTGPPQDVWALGVLLYTIIYKENPFSNVDEILAAELNLPEDIDADFTKILHAVLVKNVKQRPVAQWLLDQLESENS